MNKMRVLIAAISLMLCASMANAAVLRVSGGKLIGASGVDVDGALYNVEFIDGTCGAVFSGCDNALSDFIFHFQFEAVAASQALLDQVLLDGPIGTFDSDLSGVLGCSPASFELSCHVRTPFDLDAFSVTSADAVNEREEMFDRPDAGFVLPLEFDASSQPSVTWARWTPARSVPEPSPFPVIVLGLAGIFAARVFGGNVSGRSARVQLDSAVLRNNPNHAV